MIRALPAPLAIPWRALVVALVIFAAAFLVALVMSYGFSSDTQAFMQAAQDVAHGRTPYGPAPEWTHGYLYSPWLAWLLIPFTWLPIEALTPLWHTILALALGASMWPMIRAGGWLPALLIGAFGFHGVWAGHFEPLMICGLVYALPTRWGPVAIGVAASLKITPIVLAVHYAARGEWRKVGVSVGVAAVLWSPALLYSREGWGLPVGSTLSLMGFSPVLWALVALAALLAAWYVAPTRYGWLAAVVLWLAVMPRVLLYDVSALLVTPSVPQDRKVESRRPREDDAVDEPEVVGRAGVLGGHLQRHGVSPGADG